MEDEEKKTCGEKTNNKTEAQNELSYILLCTLFSIWLMNYLYGIRMSGDIIMDDKVNPSRTLNWKSFGPEK